jgi:hypothetical protein
MIDTNPSAAALDIGDAIPGGDHRADAAWSLEVERTPRPVMTEEVVVRAASECPALAYWEREAELR